MNNHIMLDLETLGTSADAVIVSIGAVGFDLETGEVFDANPFYTVVDLEHQMPERRISLSTLIWWLNQPQEAKAVFTEQPRQVLYNALNNLGLWIRARSMPVTVWSNGADFDIPMLTHAYTQYHLDIPWPPYSVRCYRTYKNLPGARDVETTRTGTHHNALDDAISQAHHLCAIHRKLFDGASI